MRQDFPCKHVLYVVLVVFGLCLLLFACPAPAGDSEKKASLCVTLTLPAQPRTLLPAFDMTPASFSIVGIGPSGERVEVSTAQTTAKLEDLNLGEWTVNASAFNQAAALIAEGSGTIRLADEGESELTIAVQPQAGNGVLDLTVMWQAAAVASPSITATLQPPAGSPMALPFTVESAGATCVKEDLPSGYYTLQVSLYNSTSQIAGAAEVVRILKDQTTSGVFDFTDVTAVQGSVQVNVEPRLDNPIIVEVAGRQGEKGPGQNLVLKPWMSEEISGVTCSWFVDGSLQSNEGTVSLGSNLTHGTHRVDMAVFSADGRRAGSSSFRFRVITPFPPGSLSLSTLFTDGIGGVDGLNTGHSVAVSPGGANAYVAGYGDSAVAWFARDAETGALRYRGQYKNGVEGVRGLSGVEAIAFSPDGLYLYTAAYIDGAIAIFCRDPASGALAFQGCLKNGEQGLAGLGGARGIALSPDGTSLYCACYTDSSLLVFSRDPANGNLSLVQSLVNGTGGISLLGGATSVAVAPDGSQVFTAGYTDDSLAVFQRSQADGSLTFSQGFVDGQAGCDGLNGADCVEVSSDGKNVCVSGYYDNSIAAFSRDPAAGSLAFLEVYKDGVSGVDGLRYARGVSISADGLSVYGTGSSDDAVAFFRRDASTGRLAFTSFTNGIDGARGIAVSPDGGNCYVTGSSANILAVFNRARQ